MSTLALALSIPLGIVALIFWIGLPFVLRSTRRNLRDEEVTTGTILGYEAQPFEQQGYGQWNLTVRYEVGGTEYQARVDSGGGTPRLGGSVRLRYRRRDPSYAYPGTETSPWGKTIAVAAFAVTFGVSSVVIAVLGYAGIM